MGGDDEDYIAVVATDDNDDDSDEWSLGRVALLFSHFWCLDAEGVEVVLLGFNGDLLGICVSFGRDTTFCCLLSCLCPFILALNFKFVWVYGYLSYCETWLSIVMVKTTWW
jgi:hypothetical protein